MSKVLLPEISRLITSTYWGTAGWKRDPTWDPHQRAVVEQAGIPVGSVALRHDEIVHALASVREHASLREAAESFVASLSSRRVYLRSFLSSAVIARALPSHSFRQERTPCPACGEHDTARPHDLGVLVFEKVKWGGVRHSRPLFAWLDIAVFWAYRAEATQDDRRILQALLSSLDNAPAGTPVSHATELFRDLVPGNKAERSVVLDILGIAGVLETPGHRGHYPQYQPYSERSYPPVHYCDRGFPVRWWKGGDGVNWTNARGVFGEWLEP